MSQAQIEFYQSCDERGEQGVRNILARNGWNERRTAWALAWLEEQKNSTEAVRHREAVSPAQSAARAAWASVIVAALALIVSAVALARTF